VGRVSLLSRPCGTACHPQAMAPRPAATTAATSAPNNSAFRLISFTYPFSRGSLPCSFCVHIEEGCGPYLALSIGVYVAILRHL
jgi:hypothetical protein